MLSQASFCIPQTRKSKSAATFGRSRDQTFFSRVAQLVLNPCLDGFWEDPKDIPLFALTFPRLSSRQRPVNGVNAGANATRGRKGGWARRLPLRSRFLPASFHIADRAPRLALGDPRITWTSNYLTWCNRNVTVIQNWR